LALLQTPGASVAPKPQLNLGSPWPIIFRRAVWIDLRDAKGLNYLGLRPRRDLIERQAGRPVEDTANVRDCRLSPRSRYRQGRQWVCAHGVCGNRRRQVQNHRWRRGRGDRQIPRYARGEGQDAERKGGEEDTHAPVRLAESVRTVTPAAGQSGPIQ